jgi:hypothetical protein
MLFLLCDDLLQGIVLSQQTRFRYGLYYSWMFGVDQNAVVIHSGSLVRKHYLQMFLSLFLIISLQKVFNGAFVLLLAALCVGARFVLLESFAASRWLSCVRQVRATHCIMVPTLLFSIVKQANVASHLLSLRCLISVGAPLPLATKQAVKKFRKCFV